jgi:hypothetical protein
MPKHRTSACQTRRSLRLLSWLFSWRLDAAGIHSQLHSRACRGRWVEFEWRWRSKERRRYKLHERNLQQRFPASFGSSEFVSLLGVGSSGCLLSTPSRLNPLRFAYIKTVQSTHCLLPQLIARYWEWEPDWMSYRRELWNKQSRHWVEKERSSA